MKKHSITKIGFLCFLDMTEDEAKETYARRMMDKTVAFKGIDHALSLLRHRIESSKRIEYQRIEFNDAFESTGLLVARQEFDKENENA
jgi:hypothetical protein